MGWLDPSMTAKEKEMFQRVCRQASLNDIQGVFVCPMQIIQSLDYELVFAN